MELGINSTPSVQPNEVENFIQEGCVLVDVREIRVREEKLAIRGKVEDEDHRGEQGFVILHKGCVARQRWTSGLLETRTLSYTTHVGKLLGLHDFVPQGRQHQWNCCLH